jgi:hypothetical protein
MIVCPGMCEVNIGLMSSNFQTKQKRKRIFLKFGRHKMAPLGIFVFSALSAFWRSGVLSALLSCFELNLKTNKQKWRHHTVYHLQIQLALLSETISLIMMVTVICHIFNIILCDIFYIHTGISNIDDQLE